ncbi:MAG: DUF3568 family protein [Gammaproteobacteria bacterium]
MKLSIYLIPLLAILVGGCASTETVKEAEGEGISRTYNYAYEPVYNATLAAAKVKKLEVVESDKESGRIILSHGITLWSWGERIAAFIKKVADDTTKVEIISKPVLAPLNFPPDWQQILLEQIAVELQSTK